MSDTPATDQERGPEAADRDTASLSTTELPALLVEGDWATVLEGAAREALERSVLPAFFRVQRWFGGKARRIEAVRLVDWGELPAGLSRAYPALWAVEFADGTGERYFFPLGITAGPEAVRMVHAKRPWAVARLDGGAQGQAVLHDALADDATCTAVLAAIGAGREFTMRLGKIRAFPSAAFGDLRGDPAAPLAVSRPPATSSNSLVFYGRQLLLKVFRRLETGINPEFEIGRFLTETHPFPRIPRLAGAVEYYRPGSAPVTLALLQALIPNQGDGWQYTLGELELFFDRVSGHSPPAAALAAMGAYPHAATTLGRRTAELHLALAADPHDPAFASEALAAADLAGLRQEIQEQGQAALALLQENLERLSGAVGAAARELLVEGPKVLAQLARAAPVALEACKIRCHGDYHLGQVLWVENDFILLDFEGEPTRTVEERRAKQSPLKDVAGMLRSFHYAAYAGLFAFTQQRPEAFGRLEPWAELWQRETSTAFLHAYRATAAGAAFLPTDPRQFTSLLEWFMLGKAFYELRYELNNRPDWVRIPLRGVLALLERGRGES